MSAPGSKVSMNIPNYIAKDLNITGLFEVTLSAKFYPAAKPAPSVPQQILRLPGGVGHQIQIPKVNFRLDSCLCDVN